MTLSSQYYPMKVLYCLGHTLVSKKSCLNIDLQFKFANFFLRNCIPSILNKQLMKTNKHSVIPLLKNELCHSQ